MLKALFLYEWKLLLRNKILLTSLIIFTAIAYLSFNKGVRYYHITKTEADTVWAQSKRAYANLKIAFDTTDFSKPEETRIEGVWKVDWSLWEYAIKPENPLSAISIGQNDVYSKIKRTRFATEIFSGEQDEFKNPEQLLTGNLDLSYFILFLFPLLFIAISYNTASAEKESGRYHLLATQNFSFERITTTRIIFKWLISLLPFLIVVIIAFLILSKDQNFNANAFLTWLFIALLYSIFWLVLVLLIITRGYNSMLNVLTLVGIWLLLLVGIPGILNSWFQYKYPSNTQQQITRLRDEKSKVFELPLATHQVFLKSHFPKLVIDTTKVDTMQTNWYSGAIMALHKEQHVLNLIQEEAKAQTATEENLFWINPIGGVMRAFTSISGSSLKQQQDFENHLMAFKQERADYLIANHASKKHFGKAEFAGLKTYQPATLVHEPIWKFMLPLLLLTFLLGMGVLFSKKNNSA